MQTLFTVLVTDTALKMYRHDRILHNGNTACMKRTLQQLCYGYVLERYRTSATGNAAASQQMFHRQE